VSGASAASAGLVPSSTSVPGHAFRVSFGGEHAKIQRVKRLRQALWGASTFIQLRARRYRLRCWFVTLTYRPGVLWSPKHVSACLKRMKRWASDRGVTSVPYAWVAELQKRGAVHYHLAVWLPKALSLPMFDKHGWWPHGMTQRALAIAPVGYLMKYASKCDSLGTFPKGARIYGTGGLCADGKAVRAWLGLPDWAKRLHGVGELCRRAGRLVVRETGEVLESPWVRTKCVGGLLLRLARPMADRWFSGPYSMIGAQP